MSVVNGLNGCFNVVGGEKMEGKTGDVRKRDVESMNRKMTKANP
jgi:hypothetical protein